MLDNELLATLKGISLNFNEVKAVGEVCYINCFSPLDDLLLY